MSTSVGTVRIRSSRSVATLTRRLRALSLGSAIVSFCACVADGRAASRDAGEAQGAPGEPYPDPEMPTIAPIGERIGKYIDVPASAKGPAIDPAKGYRLQDPGRGLHLVTDNAYQSMLLVYDTGVVVIDVYVWDQCYAMEQSLRIE
jgi:hypothetical protein